MPEAPSPVIFQLKASLRGISPMIWRRLFVPGELTLHGLHRVVQIAFGWEDYHLHAFNLHGRRDGIMWTGERHRDAEGREIRLTDLKLRRRQRILYEYDFGDSWEHEIRVEAMLARELAKAYPSCIAGARAGPPEDIGGPGGYHSLLDRRRGADLDRPFGDTAAEDDDADDDDPLASFEPERFSRREVNAELRREFAQPREEG